MTLDLCRVLLAQRGETLSLLRRAVGVRVISSRCASKSEDKLANAGEHAEPKSTGNCWSGEDFHGQYAPEEIRCIPILGAIFNLALQSRSGLGEFLRKSLRPTRTVDSCVTPADAWPCPLPRYRWTGASNLSPRRRRKRRHLAVRALCLQVIIATLNWHTLGHCRTPPPQARLGGFISQQQHEMIERIESLVDHFLKTPEMPLDGLGRAAEKLANLCKASFKLSSVSEFCDGDLANFLASISQEVDPYGAAPQKAATTPSNAAPMQEQQGARDGPVTVPLSTSPAKEVVADRIKWKLGPSFNPVPFLVDPVVCNAFVDPDTMRLPESEWPKRTRARAHCSRAQLLALALKWDQLGACRLIPCSEVLEKEAVGLFAVAKDAEYDRLIVNPTVINSRMRGYSNFTRTLAPGSLVGLIRLEPHEDLRISSDDLCEFYYTFKVSNERAKRNSIGIKFIGDEFLSFNCYRPELSGVECYLCLATLAMGDGLAVEIAQQSHFNLLRSVAGCLLPEETMAYRKIIPRGPFYELLTIDDHIGLQKVLNTVPLEQQDTRDRHVFRQAEAAYSQVHLTAHPGKRQRQVCHATVLGAEIDGVAGRVSAPRGRIALLMFVTAVVVRKGTCTKRLLQSILGCWIHVAMFRRPILAILDSVFEEGSHGSVDEVFKLSNQSVNEFTALFILAPLIQTDLRVDVCPMLFTMDASPTAGAICQSGVAKLALEEIWRHSEQRGYYTKLVQGPGSVLHELGLEHEELFGEESAGFVLPDAGPVLRFEDLETPRPRPPAGH